MKTLLVLRHAKSSRDNPELPDHDRPLNQRGKTDAPRMGKLLRDQGLTPDCVISSTALRARSTAEAASAASGFTGDILLRPELYAGAVQAYAQVLFSVPDGCGRVLLVGHNPDIEDFLEWLTGTAQVMSTAALAHLELPIDHWHEPLKPGTARLLHIWKPKE